MAVETLSPTYEPDTRKKLIDKDCPRFLLLIFNFAFLPMIQDITREMDAEFKGKRGPKAYPRVLLLIVVLYCFSENICRYKDMSKECKKNKYLNIILDDRIISRGTFANFLNNTDREGIHKIFIATLVLLNDIDAFSIARVFIDGTDVIVRASKSYFIRQNDLKAMDLLNEWGLLHDGSKDEIQKSLDGLDVKLKEFENDEDIVKLIKLAKKRIRIHKHKVYEKRARYEKQFEKRGDVKLSIIFPECVFMKTKKGGFDFAFNFQAVMTNNHVIFVGLLLSQPNDQKSLPDVYRQMKKTLNIYLEMQSKYGEKDNPLKHTQAFANIVMVADAGYFTVVNLYFVFKNQINAIIKPSSEARKDNDKLRTRDGHSKKETKSIRRYFKRVLGGYECNQGKFLGFKRSIHINHRKPQEDDNLPKVCKKERQIYERKRCSGCKYEDVCPKKLEDRIPFLFKWMTDRFLDKRRYVHYIHRFSRGESINGFHKTDVGIVKFVGTTLQAVENECDLRDTIFNLTRWNNLKEELI